MCLDNDAKADDGKKVIVDGHAVEADAEADGGKRVILDCHALDCRG